MRKISAWQSHQPYWSVYGFSGERTKGKVEGGMVCEAEVCALLKSTRCFSKHTQVAVGKQTCWRSLSVLMLAVQTWRCTNSFKERGHLLLALWCTYWLRWDGCGEGRKDGEGKLEFARTQTSRKSGWSLGKHQLVPLYMIKQTHVPAAKCLSLSHTHIKCPSNRCTPSRVHKW